MQLIFKYFKSLVLESSQHHNTVSGPIINSSNDNNTIDIYFNIS
jgi:hypothetical protein